MAAFTAIATALATASIPTILASASTAVGAGLQIKGQIDASKASKEAEAARLRQARLEQMRRSREIFRQSQIARANAISASTARGTQDSSILPQALSSIDSQAGAQQFALAENAEVGKDIFQANAALAEATAVAQTGSSIAGLGKTITGLRPELDNLFNAQGSQQSKFWLTGQEITKVG